MHSTFWVFKKKYNSGSIFKPFFSIEYNMKKLNDISEHR